MFGATLREFRYMYHLLIPVILPPLALLAYSGANCNVKQDLLLGPGLIGNLSL